MSGVSFNCKALQMSICMTLLVLSAGGAAAQDINKRTSLSDEGRTKVNEAKALGYLQGNQVPDTVVNIGSRSKGTCNMTVGGLPTGGNSKDTVVAAKNIINYCGQ